MVTNELPENDNKETDGDVWRVPLDFGAERGAILEHSEALIADAAILVNAHFRSLMEGGIEKEFAYALTRDFHAQWARGFWEG